MSKKGNTFSCILTCTCRKSCARNFSLRSSPGGGSTQLFIKCFLTLSKRYAFHKSSAPFHLLQNRNSRALFDFVEHRRPKPSQALPRTPSNKPVFVCTMEQIDLTISRNIWSLVIRFQSTERHRLRKVNQK